MQAPTCEWVHVGCNVVSLSKEWRHKAFNLQTIFNMQAATSHWHIPSAMSSPAFALPLLFFASTGSTNACAPVLGQASALAAPNPNCLWMQRTLHCTTNHVLPSAKCIVDMKQQQYDTSMKQGAPAAAKVWPPTTATSNSPLSIHFRRYFCTSHPQIQAEAALAWQFSDEGP